LIGSGKKDGGLYEVLGAGTKAQDISWAGRVEKRVEAVGKGVAWVSRLAI
jgi:hypothetical protein